MSDTDPLFRVKWRQGGEAKSVDGKVNLELSMLRTEQVTGEQVDLSS